MTPVNSRRREMIRQVQTSQLRARNHERKRNGQAPEHGQRLDKAAAESTPTRLQARARFPNVRVNGNTSAMTIPVTVAD